MTIALQASPGFRRGVLLASLGVALVEMGLFLVLWRLGTLVDPGADRRAALMFVAMGSAVTLQAMGVVGVAWVVVAVSRTTLLADITGVSLEHPWRRWRGAWTDVRRAWQHNGWLVLQVRGQWRRWYVRAAADAPALALVRAQLRAGVWLEGPAKHKYLARTTLPLVLGLTAAGVVLLLLVLRRLGSAGF